MSLSQALKSGIIPVTANPVDIILAAHVEGLDDLLQKQIRYHHHIMRKAKNPSDARLKFQLNCDFSDAELASMGDIKVWDENLDNNLHDLMNTLYIDDPRRIQCMSMMYSSMDILKSLRRRKIYKPVDDSTVNNCYKCGTIFTMFNRKHHCRAYGRIFCYNCSQWSERIPDDLISYMDTKPWIVPDQVSRVCQSCKDVIVNFRRIEGVVKYFEITAYPFDLCVKASTLCRDWREAIRIYLSNVRDIQYCVPSAPLSERNKRALLSNLKHIQGHSKWTLQGLKLGLMPIDGKRTKTCQDLMCDRNCTEILTSYDAIIILNTPTYNVEVRSLALKILENNYFPSDVALFLPIEDISVQEFILKRSDLFLDFFWMSRINQGVVPGMFCNKLLLANQETAIRVQESLQLISALENFNGNLYQLSLKLQNLKMPFIGPFGLIESFDADITVKNSATRPMIIRYYSDGIKKAFLYKQEDIRKDAHIVALIRLMYHLCFDIFSSFKNSSFLPVSTSPINIGSSHGDIGTWFTGTSPITPDSSRSNSHNVLDLFNKSTKDLQGPGYVLGNFTANDSALSNFGPANKLLSSINLTRGSHSLRCSGRPQNLAPSEIAHNHICEDNILSDMENHNPNNIMLKCELNRSLHASDIRSGETSLNNSLNSLSTHIDIENSFLATYRVTPVSADSGFIEIVPHASTLYDILSKGSISNYLYKSNVEKSVREVSTNYSASLAFWTVATYLLGVGDRHLENIMIRNDGILFHIDYGFVFGADTTASFVRLDHNLIEGLGGVEMYEPFKIRCCEIYCCIRRHFSLICSCLLRLSSIQPPIRGYNFTTDFIEKFITDRFLLGQTEDEAKEAFSKIIDSSRETLINRVSDVIHSTVSSFKVGWWNY